MKRETSTRRTLPVSESGLGAFILHMAAPGAPADGLELIGRHMADRPAHRPTDALGISFQTEAFQRSMYVHTGVELSIRGQAPALPGDCTRAE